MDLKPGYKQTEIGVIPEDWEVQPFGELFALRNGVNADKDSYGNGIPFINVLEPITYSHLHGSEITGQVTLSESAIASFLVKRGDILFNRTSETQEEVGLASAYLGSEPVVFGGFVIRARPRNDKLDPTYLGYALRAPFIRSQIIPMGQGAIRANIGQSNLSLVIAPIPPILEQQAIATALSDVDALIESLEQLIVKKRDLKQAAMQELLMGKKRLEGFSGQWEAKSVSDFGQIITGGTPSTQQSELWGDEFPWVTPTDISSKKEIVFTERQISEKGLSKIRELPTGSVLVTCIASIGKNVILRAKGSCNQQINAVIPSSYYDSDFLYYLFEKNKYFLISNAGKTATSIISKKLFSELLFCVPTLLEQQAIASILSDMDTAITALETKLEKARQIKQGMMQELLTGRIRLVR
jgi:type I restriction enzyme, S subunit